MQPSNEKWLQRNGVIRKKAKIYIDALENGEDVEQPKFVKLLAEVNDACEALRNWVYLETGKLLDEGKLVGLVGGEHSVPLGFMEALAERYDDFGVLHLDAHFDLRKAYENFEFSHASIFYNARKVKQISKFVHVGIRDFCEAEIDIAEGKRHKTFYDHRIREAMFEGATWRDICKKIVKQLPKNVYVSFDIDCLSPELCPNTGTPVPGGLQFQEAMYLLQSVVEAGKRIVGFDLSEVAGKGHEWDGNVGARVLYRLCNLMGVSNKK
jgi:agmatinase